MGQLSTVGSCCSLPSLAVVPERSLLNGKILVLLMDDIDVKAGTNRRAWRLRRMTGESMILKWDGGRGECNTIALGTHLI